MTVPVVAIVGRPNVGKSSLFNWLAGRHIAIVDPTAGVTRDRVSSLIQIGERFIELIDTGGIGIVDSDQLSDHVERQIQMAMDQAQVVLFVVDGRAGIAPLDERVAERLRQLNKPIVCVANKCDTPELDPQASEFYKLGQGQVVCVSAQQNRGKDKLLGIIAKRLPEIGSDETPKEAVLKLAVVGRRNTGKSTFINCLAESERMIVSEVPGTTRDSVDVRFERDGQAFIAIDTAGVRKQRSLANDVEFYSLARAERSIRRADVVLLLFDAKLRVSRVDKQLAEYILEQHKPAIFVLNKWDLMRPLPTGKMADYLRATFPSLDFVPLAFITAKSGKNVQTLLNLAQNLHKQASRRVSTGDLNRVLRARNGGKSAAAAPEPPAEGLLRHPGRGQPADHRPLHQWPRAIRQHVSTLSRENVPRRARLFGCADQAVPAQEMREEPMPAGEGEPSESKPRRKPKKVPSGKARPASGKGSELWDV